MGRRLQGAALRSKKRSQKTDDEWREQSAQSTETSWIKQQTNDELFVLDTTATTATTTATTKTTAAVASRKRNNHHPKDTTNGKRSSRQEQHQIQKLIDTHDVETLQAMVIASKPTTGTKTRIQQGRCKKDSIPPTYDLWQDMKDDTAKNDLDRTGGNNQDGEQRTKTTPNEWKKILPSPGIGGALAGTRPDAPQIKSHLSTGKPNSDTIVPIDVAKGGQSYNPDPTLHAKVIQDAVEVERRRQQAEREAKAPVSTGMSAETRALLLGSDDDEDDDDDDSSSASEDDSDHEKDDDKNKFEKKPEKLTRAQRNKQKRIRAEQREIEQRKKQKKIMNAIGEAKTVAKELRKREQESEEKWKKLQQIKEAQQRIKGKDVFLQLAKENPLEAPTFPVALPSELRQNNTTKSSLRTIKPKGSLLTDRMASFMDRGMAAKKQVKRRKRVEGKHRRTKLKVRGKGWDDAREGALLG